MVRSLIVAVIVGICTVPAWAQGDQAAGALKQCVADNTSGKDRKELAKWIFLAMAAHPEIKQYANADAAAVDETSRTIAGLVTRLLTESCLNETRAVVQGGQGSRSFQFAFEGLSSREVQDRRGGRYIGLDHHDAPAAVEHPERKGALSPCDLVVIQLHRVDCAAAEFIVARVGSEHGRKQHTGAGALRVCLHVLPAACHVSGRRFVIVS